MALPWAKAIDAKFISMNHKTPASFSIAHLCAFIVNFGWMSEATTIATQIVSLPQIPIIEREIRFYIINQFKHLYGSIIKLNMLIKTSIKNVIFTTDNNQSPSSSSSIHFFATVWQTNITFLCVQFINVNSIITTGSMPTALQRWTANKSTSTIHFTLSVDISFNWRRTISCYLKVVGIKMRIKRVGRFIYVQWNLCACFRFSSQKKEQNVVDWNVSLIIYQDN